MGAKCRPRRDAKARAITAGHFRSPTVRSNKDLDVNRFSRFDMIVIDGGHAGRGVSLVTDGAGQRGIG